MRFKKKKKNRIFILVSSFFFVSFVSTFYLLTENIFSVNKNKEGIEKKEVVYKNTKIEDEKSSSIIIAKETKTEELTLSKEEEEAKMYFQSYIIKEILKNWKQPFNYRSGDYCNIEYNFKKDSIRIFDCSGGEILKRSIELSLEKNRIKLKNNYNNVDFSKKVLYFKFFKINGDY